MFGRERKKVCQRRIVPVTVTDGLIPQISPFCRAYTIRGATHWRQKEGAKEQFLALQEDLATYNAQDTLTLYGHAGRGVPRIFP